MRGQYTGERGDAKLSLTGDRRCVIDAVVSH